MSTNQSASGHRPTRIPLGLFDYFLYATTVLSWSASWYALKLQTGVVPVQVSLVWRFVLASLIMIIWAKVARLPMKFAPATHLKFMGMGLFMFCLNFALFYHASTWIASGLLSVVFSLAAVFNMVLAIIFLGTRPTFNMVLGSIFGIVGITLMFWPFIVGQSFNQNALFGLALCILGTTFFCFGNLISGKLQMAGIPIVSACAWGMSYGVAFSLFIVVISGDRLEIDWSYSYIVSLLFLAVVSSVIAFAAYLTLLGRIGGDRAGYATVLFPILALIISTYAENYHFDLLAFSGLILVLTGNIFVMGKFGNG